MRKTLSFVTLGLMAFSLQAANFITPGNPAYEPFADATSSGGSAYAVGATLAGQTNAQGLAWVLAGATNASLLPGIASGTLSYPGLRVDSGNSASFGGPITGSFARWDINSTLGGATAETVYYSMLLNITNLGTDTGGGVFVACFSAATGATGTVPSTSLSARLLVRTNGAGGYNLGINKADGTASDYYWSPATCSLNTTYFVVGAYTFSGTPGSTNDSVSIWVNPTTNSFGTTNVPTPDATSIGSTNNGGANIGTNSAGDVIESFMVRQSNANDAYVIATELSVGVTWADVTPVPNGSLTPVFTNLAATTNTTFDTSVTLSGTLVLGHLHPPMGEGVSVSVNGNPQATTINDSTGDFTINYNPGNTPVSATPYAVTYTYGGDTNFAPATNNTTTSLYITNPLPVVLAGNKPYDGTTTIAAGALYVSNVVGSDAVVVASGTGTLAATNVGAEAITGFGTLALGGANSNNYTLTGASGSVTITTQPFTAGHPIFEPFNDATASNGTSYGVGANLAGQTNAHGLSWFAAGSGANGEPVITSGALSVPGLVAVSTNSVTYLGATGISARLDLGTAATNSTFTSSSGLTLYYSMAFQVNALDGLSATPAFVAAFNDSTGAQSNQPSIDGARLYTRLDGSGYDLGINKADGASNDIAWETNTYAVGTTYFVVAAYGFSGAPGATNDSVSLWVNPATNTFGAASAPTNDPSYVMTTAGANIGTTSVSDAIASFLLREAVAIEPGSMTVDELSIGLTWADVTPTGSTPVAPFRIVSDSLDSSKTNFILTWQSVPGASYQVVGSPTVSAARHTWTNVGSPITATGASTSATNPVTPSKNFFGVVSP